MSNLPPLLQALSAPSNLSERCNSIQDCLRLFTKHIPSKQVTLVLDNHGENNGGDGNHHHPIFLDQSTVRVAKAQLWSGPLDRIRNVSNHKGSATTLVILQDWILVLNFLELLLELRGHNKNNKRHQQQRPSPAEISPASSTAASRHNVTDMSEKDLYEQSINLLNTISNTLCTQLEQQKQDDDVNMRNDDEHEDDEHEDMDWYNRVMKHKDITDATQPVNVKAVACFVLQALLHMSNYYLRYKRPKYLTNVWRCLGDMTQAFPEPVPYQWSLTAVKALLDYLLDGALPTLTETRPDVQSLRMKQIGFFLNRIPTFLKKVSVEKEHDQVYESRLELVSKALRLQLALWRGFEHCSCCLPKNQQSFVEEERKSAAHKASKCFAIWYQKCCPVLHDPEWIPTLRQNPQVDNDNDDDMVGPEIRELTTHAVALGKCKCLLHALQLEIWWLGENDGNSHSQTASAVQRILKLVHLTLFRAIPTCLQLQQIQQLKTNTSSDGAGACVLFLAEGMPILFRALNIVLEQGDLETRHNTQKLVVYWLGLASSQERGHPLTREALVSMTTQSIRSCTHNNNSYEWCHLMAQLLFDQRTVGSLRETISNVLCRLLLQWDNEKKKSNSPNDSLLQEQVQTWLVEHAQSLLSHWWQPSEPSSNANNKKKRKRSEHQPANDKKSTMYHAESLRFVGQVLLLVPSSKFENGLVGQWGKTNRNNRLAISKTSKANDLLATALCACCHQIDSMSAIMALLASCAGLQTATESKGKGKAVDALSLALLQLLETRSRDSTEQTTLSIPQFQSLVDLLRFSTKNEKRKTVQLATIQAFGSIANKLPRNPTEESLARMAKYYKRVFSQSDWSRNALALTSLCRFRQAAPEGMYRSTTFLDRCVPASAMAMMAARENQTFHSTVTKDVKHRYSEALSQFAMDGPSQMFPKSSTIAVSKDSYIAQLTIGEGQNMATVIFPPDEDSLQQFKYMLGQKTEDPSEIFKIQRVTLDSQSGDFQIHSQAHTG